MRLADHNPTPCADPWLGQRMQARVNYKAETENTANVTANEQTT